MTARAIPFLLSLSAFVALWIVAALLTDDATVLPTPVNVLQILWAETTDGPLVGHVVATLGRVAAAFAIAMGIGVALGLLLGRSERANLWLGPWVTIFLNIPALVVIVLCYLWIGLNEVAMVCAVAVNKTAMVAVTIREGAGALDRRLSELAHVYRFGVWETARHVILPQLRPYLFAAMRNGIAIIWKIVLVAEFLGRPNGVGFQIHLYFQLFETGYVLAYAFSFVAIMLIIEIGVFSTWERRTSTWARQTG
ncbi:MAG: ABC transporter permease [Pseudomonadota bacterium]